MQKYVAAFRKKLHEGQDVTAEKQALQSIRDKYAAFYAEQMEKLHKEQAKEYLPSGELPTQSQMDEMLQH